MFESTGKKLCLIIGIVAIAAVSAARVTEGVGATTTSALGGPARSFKLKVRVSNASTVLADDYECDWMKMKMNVGNGVVAHAFVLNFRDYRSGPAEAPVKFQCKHHPESELQTLQVDLLGIAPEVPGDDCVLWWRGPGSANVNHGTIVLVEPAFTLPSASHTVCRARVITT